MAIHTKIEGDPGSIQRTVDWLRDTFGTAVTDASADASHAISTSAWDWLGATGDAFRGEVADHKALADSVSDGNDKVADEFERYGEALRAAQRKITEIRHTAAEAGLRLTGTGILEPGPAPTLPDGPVHTAAEHEVMKLAQHELTEWRHKMAAYRIARGDVEKVMQDLKSALAALTTAHGQLEKIAERAEKASGGKGKFLNKVLKMLRAGRAGWWWTSAGLIAIDSAELYCNGQPPGEIVVRELAENFGSWLEMVSNNPRVAAYLRRVGGGDQDYTELSGDKAVELYRKLFSPEIRAVIDEEIKERLRLDGEDAQDVVDGACDMKDDVVLGAEHLDDIVNALGNMALDDAGAIEQYGEDKFDEVKDGANAGLDLLHKVTSPPILELAW